MHMSVCMWKFIAEIDFLLVNLFYPDKINTTLSIPNDPFRLYSDLLIRSHHFDLFSSNLPLQVSS